jgi:hypothetical protein
LKEKSLFYFHKKIKNLKKKQNPFLVVFFRWFFLGGFFNANPVCIRIVVDADADQSFYLKADTHLNRVKFKIP